MKKLLIAFLMYISTVAVTTAAPVVANDYVFQKQIIINNAKICQAFRIHQNWFATAAHCVDVCLSANACDVRIVLAQGSVGAFARVGKKDIFIPQKYKTVDAKARVSTHKNWDVALIHFQPDEYLYEYAEGGSATSDEFRQELKQDHQLRAQWKGAVNPTIPVLYTYGKPELMKLKQNIVVPRWEYGQMQFFSSPKTVLYFGGKQSLWGSDGFGVDHGNSGGAVVLEDGGIVGIATAKYDEPLPADVREAFPTFGQAQDFFLFNGFAPKTTLAFIEKTMAQYGDHPLTRKLTKITQMDDPVLPPMP